MAVESVQFVHAVVSPGGSPPAPYLVPAGFLAVVTDIQIFATAGGRCIGRCSFGSDVAGIALLVYDSETLPVSQWHGRVALLAGDNIYCSPAGLNNSMDISVSGYLYS